MSLLQLLVATTRNYALQQRHSNFPSLLWHCWLGNRNGIQPAKSYTSDPQRFFTDGPLHLSLSDLLEIRQLKEKSSIICTSSSNL